MSGHLLIIGFGYTASALADVLVPSGWSVTGTSRDVEKLDGMAACGVVPLNWPGVDLSETLDAASHLLISIAPDAKGDAFLNAYQAPLLSSSFDWVGYLSTTGVYGDHKGRWVDETTPLAPSTGRGQFRLDAEAAWRRAADQAGWPLNIFRLAGIYGPGRGPFAKVRAGTARRIVKPGQLFSRIHVEDIAQVLVASIARGGEGRIYNVCDDDPVAPEVVIGHAAELLGVPIPPAEEFDTAEMTKMARSFYSESKRVRNDRIKHELGVELKYPSYRDGLRTLLENEKARS